MKLRVKRANGRITGVTIIAEDQEDKEVLEALFNQEVTRARMIYRKDKVILQAKVSPFPRR